MSAKANSMCPTSANPIPVSRPSASVQPPNDHNTSREEDGFTQRLHRWSRKVAKPVNGFVNRLGSEAVWPTTLDKECEKAARILQTFCDDASYGGPVVASSGPSARQRALIKIPREVIASAAGIAIFTAMRTGAQFTWGSGSGLVVARLPNGAWSPPSAFAVNTLSAGFMLALDIFDCVCVLRTPAAVAAFVGPRCSLGGEVAVTAGPVGTGAYVESVVRQDGATQPIWSYTKSRGVYVGAQIDGTIITERKLANEDFYGKDIGVAAILDGHVPSRGPMWPEGASPLMNTLRSIDAH